MGSLYHLLNIEVMRANYTINPSLILSKPLEIEVCNYHGSNEVSNYHWGNIRLEYNQFTVAIFKIKYK